MGNEDCYATDDEGRFEVPALPGRGVVVFIAEQADRYPKADGADIADLYQAGRRQLNIYHLFSLQLATAVREVNLSQTDDDAPVEIEVRPLPIAPLQLVDPEGRPLIGVVTKHLAPARVGRSYSIAWSDDRLPRSTVEIVGPRDTARTAMFLHRERHLAAAVRLAPDRDPPAQLVLHSCATMAGRVVDSSGQPVPRFHLQVHATPQTPGAERDNLQDTLDRLQSGADGRFRLADVPPGLSYMLSAIRGSERLDVTTKDVQPGETLDLGDVALKAPDPTIDDAALRRKPSATAGSTDIAASSGAADKLTAPNPSRDASDTNKSRTRPMPETPSTPHAAYKSVAPSGNSISIRGRVVLPEGGPAAGAGLYWPMIMAERPGMPDDAKFSKRGETDANGRFELQLSHRDFSTAHAWLELIALKRGYGLAWLEVNRDEPPGEDIKLQLVEDHPIRGRVTDTEGRAVREARVAVNAVLASSTGKIDGFLPAWKQEWNASFGKLDVQLHGRLGSLFGVVTDSQGCFELSGLGAERVVELEITGRDYVTAGPYVVNREGFEAAGYNQAALAREMPAMRRLRQTPTLAGPTLEHIAEAGLVVRGTVFTGESREPLVGVAVSAGVGWGHAVLTRTDEQGRYALRGLPRDHAELIHITPRASTGLLSRALSVSAASGEAGVDLDVELKRGIVITGRVFDRATGRGVQSGVRFIPLPGNHFVDQPGYDGFQHDRTQLSPEADGSFRLVVIPGPGVLMAQVHGGGPRVNGHEIKPYRIAVLSADERKSIAPTEDDDGIFFTAVDNSIEHIDNVVRIIDASTDTMELTCDLPVDPGKTAQIAIEDEKGGPLSGVFVAGIGESWPHTFKIDEPICTIYALGADRPRRLCLLHPQRHLAGGVTLTGEETGTVNVRLGAAASITGRAIDESGAPVADALVQINYARVIARELDRFATLEQPAVKTDAEGRFQIGDIVPGERFALDFKQDDHYFRANLSDDQRQLQAGRKLDLGDIKTRQLR